MFGKRSYVDAGFLLKGRIGGICIAFLLFFFCACRDEPRFFPYADITHEYYDSLRNKSLFIDADKVRWYVDSIRLAAHDTAYADIYVDRIYARRAPYIWIDTRGADSRADTLVALLAAADSDALRPASVYLSSVSRELARLRSLDFSTGADINLCLARLEYFATKGLMRYATAMRYGIVNPYKLYNRLDLANPEDTLSTQYRTLYDVPTETPSRRFFDSVVTAARAGTFAALVRASRPVGANYLRLRQAYNSRRATAGERRSLAVNMERYRWRTSRGGDKYVWINLPEYLLRASDSSSDTVATLTMRVCEGSVKHKTPQLTSRIERLELNPVWTVPQSIISREIAAHHAEDAAYFERNKMKVIDKSTGDEVPPASITADMLRSGGYSVVQNKGDGNALGRMIFRFKNNFAIFLHDTPNRDAFSQQRRALSHGCIRLENPFALAVFLLPDKDPLVIDKMRIAIDMPPTTDEGRRLAAQEDYKTMGLKTFRPPVPLYITYFTAYPDATGRIIYTADPYGYDEKIYSLLRSY